MLVFSGDAVVPEVNRAELIGNDVGRGKRGSIDPVPVAAHSLWLSGLGAWLDLHGAWTTGPYSESEIGSILAWDHVAPLGGDRL